MPISSDAACPVEAGAREQHFDPLGPVAFVPLINRPRFNHRTCAEVDQFAVASNRGPTAGAAAILGDGR